MMITTREVVEEQPVQSVKKIRNIQFRRLFILGMFILVMGWTLYVPSRTPNSLLYSSEKDLSNIIHSNAEKYETLTWVIVLDERHDDEIETIVDSISEELGLVNLGKVGKLSLHYLLAHPWHEHGLVWPGINFKKASNKKKFWHQQLNTTTKWSKIKHSINTNLDSHPLVSSFAQQNALKRVKRYQNLFPEKNIGKVSSSSSSSSSSPSSSSLSSSSSSSSSSLSLLQQKDSIYFNDPLFHKQWHLKNVINIHHDVNVTGVWLRNITGRGVTIAVVDDGLDWLSPDIRPNYNPDGSIDVVSNDNDPSPSNLKKTNNHGTRCAGEIAAAANNSFCGVGVAYGGRVSGIRLIEGPMTDEAEARAFSEKMSVNDVYSCSWGPVDDGKTLDGPHRLAQKALRLGTDYGRNGYGSVYVVASGNGGRKGDNCNYDGYANSIYTVTIGAVDEHGAMPSYSEECASMLAVAYSSGSSFGRTVVTSDWSMYGDEGCTENHTGTSAAAPLAAGIVALMLEVRPCLTWRDVQYLIVFNAIKVVVEGVTWTRNDVGLSHSHQHGFGIMDAWKLVNAAKVWKSVPWMTSFSTNTNETKLEIRSGQAVTCETIVSKIDMENVGLNTLEYVHLILTLEHEFRGQVEVHLICPSGTSSIVGATRPLDDSKDGLKDWIFSTVRCWGEKGHGLWQVLVRDYGVRDNKTTRGYILKWRLQLYGSPLTGEEIAEKIKVSQESYSGEFLNSSFQLKCDPPPLRTRMGGYISEKCLKILIVIGAFVVVMAISDIVEYSLCYQEEKKEQSKLFDLTVLAHSLMREGRGSALMDDSIRLLPLSNSSTFPDEQLVGNLSSETVSGTDGFGMESLNPEYCAKNKSLFNGVCTNMSYKMEDDDDNDYDDDGGIKMVTMGDSHPNDMDIHPDKYNNGGDDGDKNSTFHRYRLEKKSNSFLTSALKLFRNKFKISRKSSKQLGDLSDVSTQVPLNYNRINHDDDDNDRDDDNDDRGDDNDDGNDDGDDCHSDEERVNLLSSGS